MTLSQLGFDFIQAYTARKEMAKTMQIISEYAAAVHMILALVMVCKGLIIVSIRFLYHHIPKSPSDRLRRNYRTHRRRNAKLPLFQLRRKIPLWNEHHSSLRYVHIPYLEFYRLQTQGFDRMHRDSGSDRLSTFAMRLSALVLVHDGNVLLP